MSQLIEFPTALLIILVLCLPMQYCARPAQAMLEDGEYSVASAPKPSVSNDDIARVLREILDRLHRLEGLEKRIRDLEEALIGNGTFVCAHALESASVGKHFRAKAFDGDFYEPLATESIEKDDVIMIVRKGFTDRSATKPDLICHDSPP